MLWFLISVKITPKVFYFMTPLSVLFMKRLITASIFTNRGHTSTLNYTVTVRFSPPKPLLSRQNIEPKEAKIANFTPPPPPVKKTKKHTCHFKSKPPPVFPVGKLADSSVVFELHAHLCKVASVAGNATLLCH